MRIHFNERINKYSNDNGVHGLYYLFSLLDDFVLGSYMFDKDRERGLSGQFAYRQLILIKH